MIIGENVSAPDKFFTKDTSTSCEAYLPRDSIKQCPAILHE